MRRRIGTLATALSAAAAIGMACGTAVAQSGPQSGAPSPAPADVPRPSTFFVQAGVAQDARMLIVGAIWNWHWQRVTSFGRLGGYWEASFGRWSSDGPEGGHAWVTQVGLTPVLRLHPASWGGDWFVEGGIGANFLLPIYRSSTKRFSTAFNFGDHIAVGRRFGQGARHELALRLQHFSNAGIREPNPGEDFVQIRYGWLF